MGREKLCLVVDLGVLEKAEVSVELAHRGDEISHVVVSRTRASDNDEIQVRPRLAVDGLRAVDQPVAARRRELPADLRGRGEEFRGHDSRPIGSDAYGWATAWKSMK
ncbi:hypothetical protein NN3_29110 [Nocardia neocaledoniensis NBRC 108232]|nr:hypothetical protein NN3_29110 [Nocardia neocaledoniensis NBRC 108232]